MTYQEYMRSRLWRENRDAAMARAGYACEFCGAVAYTAHHVKYPSRFEDDTPDNLVAVCDKHHALCHGKREHKVMSSQSIEVFRSIEVLSIHTDSDWPFILKDHVMKVALDGLVGSTRERARHDIEHVATMFTKRRHFIHETIQVQGRPKLCTFWSYHAIMRITAIVPGNMEEFSIWYENTFERGHRGTELTGDEAIDTVLKTQIATLREQVQQRKMLESIDHRVHLLEQAPALPFTPETPISGRNWLTDNRINPDDTVTNRWGDKVNVAQWFGTEASRILGKAPKLTMPGQHIAVSVRSREDWRRVATQVRDKLVPLIQRD